MRVSYEIEQTTIFAHHGQAIVLNDEHTREAMVEQIIQDLSLDVFVTVGDVTMPLACWMDPEHWEDDWREAERDADEVVSENTSQ